MKTKLQILQGAGQIGGNIVLIEGEKSRLVIDFGIPVTELDGNPTDLKLNDEKVKKYLPDIPDLYENKQKKETIILLSHAHPDHFGLLRYVNTSIPIYTMRYTKDLILTCSKLLYDNLFDDVNLIEIKDKIDLCDFVIEAFPVDHSVAGACAFKITDKMSNKVILYSGDIRLHGRSRNETEFFAKFNTEPDYLILEGTTLSRAESEDDTLTTKTENDVENELAEIFSENKMSIVCCSPLNIDRIVSVHNACKRANKTLIIDPYSALILETFKGNGLPYYRSENIKVYCVPNSQSEKVFKNSNNKKFGLNKISFEDIMKEPEKYVIKDNFKISEFISKRMSFDDINIVYSYWDGYLEDEKYRWHDYINQLKRVHTSGHISKKDLIKLVEKINAKNIIPIHTLAAYKFREYFGDKVLELDKKSILEIN